MEKTDGAERSAVSGLKAVICLAVLLATLSVLPACQPAPQSRQPADEVKLQLKWVHQAQFAGFYLAQERGYYRDENINLILLEGGTDVDIVQRLANGQADFAIIAPETLLIVREQGRPFIAIAAIDQRSPVVYIAKAESGIIRPRDFLGRTVATQDVGGSQQDMQVQFYAMMKKLGLDISRVKVVPWDYTYAGFHSGDVDVTPCYSINTVIRFRQQGMKLNLIWPSDYGVHLYADLIITTNNLAENNPGLATRFLSASLKGWQDAVEDYQHAVTVSLKYSSNKDAAFQTAMMEAMLPLVHTGQEHIGWMKPEDWQDMYGMFKEEGLLSKPFYPGDIYTMRFLQEVYKDKKK